MKHADFWLTSSARASSGLLIPSLQLQSNQGAGSHLSKPSAESLNEPRFMKAQCTMESAG